MLAGHLGIALAASRIEPRIGLGTLAAASLLADLLLWTLVLAGVESVTIPPDFAVTRQPRFEFPVSHGLAASVGWSAIAGALAAAFVDAAAATRRRIALVVAATVLSHWLVDALVHRPELPLAGPGSALVGAGLWDHLAVALGIEAAIVAGGMALYFPARGMSPGRQAALAALIVLVTIVTTAGMTLAPPPPSATAMAASSLGVLVVVCIAIGWLDRARVREATATRVGASDR